MSTARTAADDGATSGASRASGGGQVVAGTDAGGDGVDLSLIRWMLGLTPAERLDALQGFVDSAVSLRDAASGP